MFEKVVSFALKQRLLMLVGLVLLLAGGLWALKTIPIDAFPDVTTVQVQVITEAPGLAPVEVERLVTFPIEVQMTGLPDIVDVRSLSKFGLSMVTVVFQDRVDSYFARQLVLERLIEARDKLPPGVEPVMGPISTGLGEVYQYTVERDGVGPTDDPKALMELREIEDWIIRPRLKTVPGVTDVNTFGGQVRQFQVLADPDRLRKYDLTLREIFDAVAANNANAGGNFLEHASEQYLIRGIGLTRGLDDLQRIVVKSAHGNPVFIRDVAEVTFGPEVRQGAAVKDGKGEVVVGIVLMLKGASGRDVAASVKDAIAQIAPTLPEGVKIKPYYDRTDLVRECLKTVSEALLEGLILVLLVLFLFLGNVRSALVVASTLPIATLATFLVMRLAGVSANLMSLGGLAIAMGMMVDGSVVVVENTYRHLSERAGLRSGRLHAVLESTLEVAKPVTFGILIIIAVFLPLFTLQGMEGKMFSPMAFTIAIALFCSLLLSFTFVPLFSSLLIRGGSEEDNRVMRVSKRLYRPVLAWALNHRKAVFLCALGLLAGSLALVPFLGTEFLPVLDEGVLTPQVIRIPSIALPDSIAVEKEMQRRLMKYPEVVTVISRIGRAEIASDPMGPNLSDPYVILKPKKEWKTAKTREALLEIIREDLSAIPGIGLNLSQPIALRVDELVSGVKSQLAVKIFGEDMGVLEQRANEMARVLSGIRGAADLRVEQVSGQAYLSITPDRAKIARYGINVADINDLIRVAIGGAEATEVFEGQRRFSVVVRYPEASRKDEQAIGNLLVSAPGGARIPLAELAEIKMEEGPVQISREAAERRIVVECNVSGRDIGSFVAEAQRAIAAKVKLPPGYRMAWAGQFENQQRAMARLKIVVPVVIGLIFLLLFSAFNTVRHATLIILNIPFALVGGITALFVSGLNLSVAASVGFIALFGVAVLNGVVLVSYLNKLRQEGMGIREAILTGTELRLRPVLMTALVSALGLVPLLLSSGTGSEIQKPLAVVVVGGLVTSTFLTLVVLPVFYEWTEAKIGETNGEVSP